MTDIDTRRCDCECPMCDHPDVPIRYVLKASMRHYLMQKIDVMFGRR